MGIEKIAVAGAGLMGSGIAQLAAMADFQVQLYDISDEQLTIARERIEQNLHGAAKRGKIKSEAISNILSKIKTTNRIKAINADLLIEAIIERLEIKVQLFKAVAANNAANMILASNTSSIPITQIAKEIENPSRVIGMHFFNPAHIMKFVEVISGVETDAKVAKAIFDLAERMGKKPVYAADAPGFIVNRVARHFYVESLKILEENVAPIEIIDGLIKNNGFKMGPFELMDLIGVETNLSVTQSMFESFNFDGKFRPSRIQQQKADAGHYGRKSGKGFYDYHKSK